MFQDQRPLGNLVEEITVMGYDEVRPAEIQQSLFQHFPRRDVEMVRRFVEDKEIRPLQEKLQQGQPGLFAAAEAVDDLEDIVAAEHEAPQDGPGFFFAITEIVHDFIEDRPSSVQVRVFLGKIADMDAAAQGDMTVCRFLFAHDHADERRLPRPIGADEGSRFAAAQEER